MGCRTSKPKKRDLLAEVSKWSDRRHDVFEVTIMIPKDVMRKLHDAAREFRKKAEDPFFTKKRGNLGEHKHIMDCKEGSASASSKAFLQLISTKNHSER